MPVYNEEAVLEKNINLLKNFLENNLAGYDWQIIIADNASQDKTGAISKKLTTQEKIKYFFIPQKGRGLALRRAFLENPGDFYLYMDIDLATDLSAIPLMLDYLSREKYDVVTGSRFVPGSKISRSFLRKIISRGYIFIAQKLLDTRLSDLQCGFKGINSNTVKNITPQVRDNQWFFDTELMLLAEKNKCRLKEIPISWVETRSLGRKSKVKLIKSIYQFLINLFRLRSRLKTN
ncbi:MAG: glycosyltransferase [Patescibacteria group bacterium]